MVEEGLGGEVSEKVQFEVDGRDVGLADLGAGFEGVARREGGREGGREVMREMGWEGLGSWLKQIDTIFG